MTPSFSRSPGAWSFERKCSIRHLHVHRDEDSNDSSPPSHSRNKQDKLTSSVSLKSLLSGTDATLFDSEETCSDDDNNNSINEKSTSSSSSGTSLPGMTSSSPAELAAISLQERAARSIQQQEIKMREWTKIIEYQQSLVTVRVQSGNDIVIAMKKLLKVEAQRDRTLNSLAALKQLYQDVITTGTGENVDVGPTVATQLESILASAKTMTGFDEHQRWQNQLCTFQDVLRFAQDRVALLLRQWEESSDYKAGAARAN